MAKVFFSSWNGKIIDERKKVAAERKDLQELKFPGQLGDRALRAFIGWAGLVVSDPDLDLVTALAVFYGKMQKESCGRCVPCRAGSKIISDRLAAILSGEGKESDLEFLVEIADLVASGSLCELGISSPKPLKDALLYFRDHFLTHISAHQSSLTKPLSTDHYETILTAPCRNGCPAHINIPGYLESIREGDYEEALAINREKTPFVGTLGRVCVHPCESNCNRQPVDQALSIRLSKRFVADFGLRNGYDQQLKKQVVKSAGERVAIIGAGPAGINAAYQLSRKGYGVTVYEALPVAGGMLAVGIPSYRLPRDILNYEIDLVCRMGVEIICNTRVGSDITIDQIWQEGFKAIFIANGLHESATMGCEGEDACYLGYMPGVEFLRRINLGQKVELGDTISVIGGGNVAMDCARSAVRLGVKEVNLIYRRTRNEMPANAAEIRAAEEEGINFHLLANPVCILEDGGVVSGMECIKMELGDPDVSGRRRPVPVDGSEFILKAESVIPAIGQVANFDFLGENSAVKLSRWGTLEVDDNTMETAAAGIFAGGDAVLGARTVIEAIATANRAAVAIDAYIRKARAAVGPAFYFERFLETAGVYNPDGVPEMVGARKRREEEVLPVSERISGFAEADLGFKGPGTAIAESERCVKCLRLGLAVLDAGRAEND
ncbi:MAG: hypothetical protein FJ152_02280 [Firmicutes bacterium]|nr:hypothetical protein [Bacillota bacterium]